MRVKKKTLGFPLWVVDYDTFVAKVEGGGGVKFETKNELAREIEKGEEIFSWKKNIVQYHHCLQFEHLHDS